MSRVSKLLTKVPSEPWRYTFTPLVHSDIYFDELELRGEDTTRMRKLHEECPYVPPEPIPPKKKWDIPQYLDWVPVKLTVTPSGKVKCHIKPAMADLYKSPCHRKPSIEARIKACKDFGYPDEVLLDVLAKHEKRVANQPAIEEFLISVFGEETNKKPAPPKKKTLQQIFKFKKMVYPKVDDDPELEERSDDEIEEDKNVDVD